MKKLYLITLLLCICTLQSHAVEGLRFENITNKDGLSHNTIRHIMQDKRGFIWISTINGLNRYDGRRFVVMLPEFGSSSLTESKIKRTIEDSNGRIWIHSTSGIFNCYDTRTESFVDYAGDGKVREYENFYHLSNGDVWLCGSKNGACRVQYINDRLTSSLYNKTNIKTNVVNFVYEDSNRQVWLGTNMGLIKIVNGVPEYCYIGQDNLALHSGIELGEHIYFFTSQNKILVFDRLLKTYLHDISISDREVFDINHTVALDENRILIAGKQATYILDIKSSKITSARDLFDGVEMKGINIITDNRKNYWLYNKSGNIWKYERYESRFKKFQLIPNSILSIIDLERYNIYCDSRNIVWITTYGNGLFIIDQNTGKISHLTAANSDLKTNYLLSALEDKSGEIWIGTEHTGISKISLTKHRNKVFFPDPDKTSAENKIIRTIYEDKSGDIWLGTKSGNIYIFDKDLKWKNTLSLSRGMPYCFSEDIDGNKWVGTKGNGLVIYSGKDNKLLETHTYVVGSKDGISNNSIYSILNDSEGDMWLGTFGGGLLYADSIEGKLQFKRISVLSKDQKWVRCLLQDDSGMIWVGGNNGIIIFDPKKIVKEPDNFRTFSFNKDNPLSLNNNEVKVIIEDNKKRIWIGTSGGGLNLAVKDSVTNDIQFKHYSTEDGLINDVIQAILEDDDGNLWISTESGISKYNTVTNLFESYNFLDTWESDLFCESSCFKRSNGELMFGSYNGMYIFDPSSFRNSDNNLSVIITGFSINGISVTPNSTDSPLDRSITETKKIRLKNGQNSFSIEFSSLLFEDASSNRYTYILDGYDKVWNPITQYNVATYKNIPAGKYTFKVKGSSNSGNWNEKETILEIIIAPPFWKSWQAFLLYLILFVVLCIFTIRLILKMNKLHNDVVVEKQLTEYRLRFFTNISHEFRTPLTIIKGSIENMNTIESIPPSLKKHIKTLDKSSSRLMRLIDQLLEFRKIQNDKMELQLEYTEAVSFFKEIYNMFAETAERKHVDFKFSSSKESIIVLLDRGKMDKVTFNLLSNAFKHTPESGTVEMRIDFDADDNLMILSVSDSGIGIPKEKRALLFTRFKQINYTASGIGIGLHLTSELVNIHKGNIKYDDSEWQGARFTVSIPIADTEYNKDDIIDSTPIILHSTSAIDKNMPTEQVKAESLKVYVILIIEDDEEIRLFLENQLGEYFTVITAPNGLIGWETAMREQPNLVLCDVMMPEMDGYEVTKKLKSDFHTSHIPIVLLTAHSSMEHQLEGINAGADAYIIKPFSIKYLLTRIIKLIEQRENLQQKFAHDPGTIQPIICTTNKDNDFIQKIHDIIGKNLDNPEFTIDEFAQSVHLGRTIFYKKVKGITGYSPNEYIRIIRLKKSAVFLKSTDLNISEVAYKVGFNDPFYFSKCFKEQFEMTPSQFRESKQ